MVETDRQTGGLHTFGVSFDGAGQTEKLNEPTVIYHQRLNETTGQDLDTQADRQVKRETGRQTV